MLIHFRLRWYILASGRLLLRHWLWLLVVGLAVPGLPIIALLLAPAQALDGLLLARQTPVATFTGLVAVQLLMLLWVAPQRRPLHGADDFAAFVASLPIPPLARRAVDLTVLSVADALPLVVAAVALASAFVSRESPGLVLPLALLPLLATILLVQLAWLERRRGLLAVAAVADLPITLALGSRDAWWAAALLAVTLLAIVGVFLASPRRRPARRAARQVVVARSANRGLFGPAPLALRLQLKVVAAFSFATALRLLLAVGLAIGTAELVAAFALDARALPTAIVGLAGIALVLGGFYRVLRDVHAPAAAFVATLPLPRYYWATRDSSFVMLLGVAPLAIVLAPIMMYDHVPPAAMLLLVIADLALLALLRLSLVGTGKLGPLLAVFIAAGWAGGAIAAVIA